ncbi:MAG: restriction endonuclease subunit S, partial [Tannerella sp.]|nr:restriction endonuclease subunit S [Tannerella sp.]
MKATSSFDISHYEKFADGTVKCIDGEIPFEVPEGWEWTRLGNIASHNTGKTLDKGRNVGILRDYITTSNLYWGFFELE